MNSKYKKYEGMKKGMDYVSYVLSALVGGLVAGAVVGLVPAICGFIKKKTGLAIGGFFACAASGAILGLILSVPMCVMFLFLIFRKKPATDGEMAQNMASDDKKTEVVSETDGSRL